MSAHPHLGVPGAKPRLQKPSGNGAPSKEAIAKLSHEYLETRNAQMRSKAAVADMELRRRLGELIPRKRVFDTLAHYMTIFRQRSLLLHRSVAQRLVSLAIVTQENEHAVSRVIDEEVRSLLNELGNLPDKACDPNWIDELARKEIGLTDIERPQTPKEHKQEQARIEKRRAQKAETMRKLRQRG